MDIAHSFNQGLGIRLEKAFKGSNVHAIFQEKVRVYAKENGLDVFSLFKRMPDVKMGDYWWDVTTSTPGSWERHLIKYGKIGYGPDKAIPLLYDPW